MNNKGFTLVELIISMALMSIVVVTASFMLTTSARTYESVQNNIQLQMDSQMAMTQIQDIFTNANAAVRFSSTGSTSYVVNHIDTNANGLVDTSGDEWELHLLYYDSGADIMYYDYVGPTGNINDINTRINQVMNYPVTNIPTDVLAKGLTRFAFTFTSGGGDPVAIEELELEYTFVRDRLEYTTKQNISLRNAVFSPESDYTAGDHLVVNDFITDLKEIRGENREIDTP